MQPIFQLNTKARLDAQTSVSEPELDCDFDDVPDEAEFSENTDALDGYPIIGQYLLHTARPEFIPIKVPFLCGAEPYDNLGFWDFPTRMGWKVNREDRWCHSFCPPGTCKAQEHNEASDAPNGLACPAVTKKGLKAFFTPTTTRDKIAFLQAWLFFGALDEICALCGLELDVMKTFVVEGMVTTESLNGLPGRLYKSSLRQLYLVPMLLKRQLLRVARYVQLMITRRSIVDEHEYTFEECLVLSSINVVLRVILMTALHYFPSGPWDNFWKETEPVSCLVDPGWLSEGQRSMQFLLQKQSLPSGWCSSSELDGLDYDSKFFAYFLKRPHAPLDHSRCTDTKCLANQTDAKTYQTAHVSDGCHCSFIAVDPEQLKDSLERNQIPKITIVLDSDNSASTISLKVVDGKNQPYIAISHVWADGLGNPRENSLPYCQLLRLGSLIDGVMKTIRRDDGKNQHAFWIDTLCIPVAPHFKNYRNLAIQRIRETFRDATATLVLDKELYNLDTRGISNMEIGIRIFCGGWTKRLWTLKEAVYTLATGDNEKLFFQMNEDLVEWNRTHSKFKYHLSQNNNSPFIRDSNGSSDSGSNVDLLKLEILFEPFIEIAMKSRLPSLRSFTDSNEGNTPRFLRLADAVAKRSTSRQEDEPLCLTYLLGRPAQHILASQDVEERMMLFYLELKKIPKAIIFEYVSDDVTIADLQSELSVKDALLQKSPFRWAPASLASLSARKLETIRLIHGRLVDKNFQSLGDCETDGLHIRNSGFLLTGKNNGVRLLSYSKDINTGEIYELTCSKEPPNGYCGELGILRLESSLLSDSAAILQIEETHCVVDEDQNAYEYYGTIIGHGKFSRWTTPEDSLPEGYRVLNGQMLDTSQRWCVT